MSRERSAEGPFPISADRSKNHRARPRPPFECIALLL
jgi:hypothetical protein